jgi:putative membrane protein
MFLRKLAVLIGAVTSVAIMAPAAEAMAPPARRLDPDAAFLRTAHQGNLAQIALGRIAARKAVSPRVRGLGAQFAADSVRLDAAVRDTAKALDVALDPEPNSTVRQSVLLYRSTSAEDFDTLFLTSQAALHKRAVRLVRIELADGDQAEVRRIAEGALPIIQRHRAALRRLTRP